MPTLRKISELKNNPGRVAAASSAVERSVATAEKYGHGDGEITVPAFREINTVVDVISRSSPLTAAANQNSDAAPDSSMRDGSSAQKANASDTFALVRGNPTNELSAARKKSKYSSFRGVTFAKKDGTYVTQLCIAGKICYVGRYRLETDAALAYDIAVRYLTENELCNKTGQTWKQHNFNSEEDYQRVRAEEVQGRQLSGSDRIVDILSMKIKVHSLVDKFLKKAESSDVNSNNDDEHTAGVIERSSPWVPRADENGDARVSVPAFGEINGPECNPNEDAVAGMIASTLPSITVVKENSDVAPDSSMQDGSSAQKANVSDTLALVGGNPANELSAARKKSKYSSFRGVTFAKKDGTYVTQLCIAGKICYVGRYRLETDAALAYDIAVRYLTENELCNKTGQTWKQHNFNSEEDYQRVRAEEVQGRQLSGSDRIVDILSMKIKVHSLVDKFLKKAESNDVNTNTDEHTAGVIGRSSPSVAFIDENGGARVSVPAFGEIKGPECNPNQDAIAGMIASTLPSITVTKENSDVAPDSNVRDSSSAQIENMSETPSPVRDNPTDEPVMTFPKTKSSRFNNVTLDKSGAYRTQLRISGKQCYLASYRLEADAAFAHDVAAMYLADNGLQDISGQTGKQKTKKNFNSEEDYQRSRAEELQGRQMSGPDTNLDMFSIKTKILGIVDNFLMKAELSDGKTNIDDDQVTIREKKGGSSRFHGVAVVKMDNTYVTFVYVHGKQCLGGSYHLEADAAFACDTIASYFSGGKLSMRQNFNSLDEFQEARTKERRERELSNGLDLLELKAKIQGYINTFLNSAHQNLKGTCKLPNSKYQAQIYHNKKQHNLGKRQLILVCF